MIHQDKLVSGIFLCFIFFLSVKVYLWKNSSYSEENISEVDVWLQEHNLSEYKNLFKEHGVVSLVNCAQINLLPDVSEGDKEKLQKASESLQKQLILRKWLNFHNIEHLYSRLLQTGVASLDDIQHTDYPSEVTDLSTVTTAKQTLPSEKDEFENLKLKLWNDIISNEHENEGSWTWGKKQNLIMARREIARIPSNHHRGGCC